MLVFVPFYWMDTGLTGFALIVDTLYDHREYPVTHHDCSTDTYCYGRIPVIPHNNRPIGSGTCL